MKEMSFQEHLQDLWKMCVRVLIILGVSFVVTYSIGDEIARFLMVPIEAAIQNKGQMVQLGILDKVVAQFQLAFWSSILLSSPLWFRELWVFIKPGLHPHEVRIVRPFIFVSFVFFILGLLFGYYVVFPVTFETLLNFGVDGITPTLGIKEYLVLSCKVLLFLGIVFQLPNIMLILGFMGLVTKQSLNSMRRYVYVAFSLVAAILTPPDVVTMMGLWLPLAVLYEVGIIAVALIVHPYLARIHAS